MAESAGSPATGPSRRWSLARLSIEYKLPVFICALILVFSAAYSWTAYREVRLSAITAARERLVSITDQLAGLLGASTARMLDSLRVHPAHAAALRYLQTPNPRTRADAARTLATLGPQLAQVVSNELWSADRQRLLSVPHDSGLLAAGLQPENVQWAPGPDSGAVGRIQVIGDSLIFPVAEVLSAGGAVRGWLVQWRRITTAPRDREQTLRLIGTGAGLFIGNDRGPVWTDLLRPVPEPPMELRTVQGSVEYDRPGMGQVLARARPIPGTAWVVLIEFPLSAVFAPVRQLVRRLALFLGLLALVGVGLSWIVGRRIANPLRELTASTAAVAAGDFSTPVRVHGQDELGSLATSFNAMMGRVRESQQALEAQVRERTAELQERNDELEAFGYSISHDLRAPLRAMQGFSQALLEDSGDRLDPLGREYAERIVNGARRMDELIQDLLAYSKVSRGDVPLAPVPLGLLTLSALEELDPALRARGGAVQIEDPLPVVLGHPATLRQVLTNLFSNALKFVPSDRTPALRIRSEVRNGGFRVWVEDNGIGIAPEHRERIFRVFERLHGGDDYPGTGIGLAIVRKAVERMGGGVGVESTPGQGSRFWVDLHSAGSEQA